VTALLAKGLSKSFRGRRVVDGVSFSVAPGEVVGLLGPNGAGKTTSFHCVVGLLAPDGGEVRLGGRDLVGLPLHERARLGIGYLPQEPSIFRKLTVRENFLLVLESSSLPKKARDQRADELLSEFDLLRVANSKGETLSGGERRRAEIARSDVHHPVGDPEARDDLLFDTEELLVDRGGLLGGRIDEHFHLVELVDPEDASGVPSRRSGLAAEVRRVSNVPKGQ